MKVKDMMTRNIITISDDELASVAARILSRHNIGILPVCDQAGKLCGMITDRDVLIRCIAADKEPGKTPVREIMTQRVVSCNSNDSVEEAAKTMAREQVRRLPVVDEKKLVGMLSLGDLSMNKTLKMEASNCLAEICSNIRKE